MARPGVTYFEVSNAVQQLIAAGKTPTIESIRIKLGRRGSNSTIGTHLRALKEKQNQTQQIATKENLPEELIAMLKGLWERVMGQSEEKIQIIQQEAQEELAKIKQEFQHLQQDNAQWQQRYQQTKQEKDGLTHEKLAVEQLLINTNIEVATLTEKLIGFEQQNQEKQTQINELHRQNQQAQANLEHYRTASLEQRLIDQQRYEQQQKQLEQVIQKINQELAALEKEKTMLQQQSQQVNFENGNLKAQLNKLEAKHESIAMHLTTTLNDLAKQTQSQEHWKEQFQILQGKHEEQSKSFIEIQTQYLILLQQSETMKIELNELCEQNKSLAHEKWILGQEKAQLYGQLKQLASSI